MWKILIVILISRHGKLDEEFLIHWVPTHSTHRYSGQSPRHLEFRNGWYSDLWQKLYEGGEEDLIKKLKNLELIMKLN